MTRGRVLVLASVTVLGACTRRPPVPEPKPGYTVGAAYQAGGTWFYPREQFGYHATGLATVEARRTGLTADGERADPGGMTASHQTLQLPAVARVTNLENGRQALVRINDRGPPEVGRILALSPKAASVLGVHEGTRVRVELDEATSHAAADAAGGAPSLAMQAAPLQSIQAESLAPPPGATQSARGRTAPSVVRPAYAAASASVTAPDRLPETFTQGIVDRGQLYLRSGEFGQMSYAQGERAKLAGLPVQIERVHEPRQDRFRIRAGPFATVAQADAALRQALNAGVVDARIVVEEDTGKAVAQ